MVEPKDKHIYCEILNHALSFMRKVEEDERIKDDSIKELSIIYFNRGLGVIGYLPDIDKFPTFAIIDLLTARLDNIAYTEKSSTEKWRMLKEYLNKEYTENCQR